MDASWWQCVRVRVRVHVQASMCVCVCVSVSVCLGSLVVERKRESASG